MKRLVLATSSLVVAGGMAAADVAVTGSAELGVSGASGEDAKLHRDIRVKFGLSGATDTGLSFGASADFHNAGKYRSGGSEGAVHLTGAFGTLTLGNTDGGFDKALTEVGSATSIADDHTSHPGYNGNSGLDGNTGNGGAILRYDYSLGGVTTSVSAEFGADDSSNSVFGAGVAWSGDVGGIGMGVGVGWQSAKQMLGAMTAYPGLCTSADAATQRPCDLTTNPTDVVVKEAVTGMMAGNQKASIIGMSASADMGNGFSVVANYSRKSDEMVRGTVDSATTVTATTQGDDSSMTVAHTGIGIAYSVGDITVGVNGGSSTTKTTELRWDPDADTPAAISTTTEEKANGIGVAVVYSLGTGVNFQVGAGSGKTGDMKSSSWSAGLAFSF